MEHASRCGWHSAKTSRIENNKTAPSADDIRAWCAACGAEDQADDLIASLRTVEGMFVDWRRLVREGLSQAQQSRAPIYERTKRFKAYSSWLMPGMIQTPGYAEAVFRAARRLHGTVDDVEHALAARLDRQRLLTGGRRTYALIIEESVMRAGIGGEAVMAEQLDHLAEVATLPNVSLGIIPARSDRERWPVEDFWIFDNARVNVELVSGYLTVTAPSEVRQYAETFAELAGMAVFDAKMRDLVRAAIKAL